MRSGRSQSMGGSPIHHKSSADLEMDLQVSKARQSQVLQEIEKLREIKQCMEEAKAKGQ